MPLHDISAATGDWINWTPTLTGFSGSPTLSFARYTVIGNTVLGMLVASGTGDGSLNHTATLPVTAASDCVAGVVVHVGDSGASGDTVGNFDVLGSVSTTALQIYATIGGGAGGWSAGGTHFFGGMFVYQRAG